MIQSRLPRWPDQYTPSAQAWIAAHPRFNSDPAYRAKMIAAHDAAVLRFLESPEYFREMDRAAAGLGVPPASVDYGALDVAVRNILRDPHHRSTAKYMLRTAISEY